MEAKIKTVREFTFKAYAVVKGTKIAADEVTGEFMTKSECHYYCEKAVLDAVKANAKAVEKDGISYAIYKVCTKEQSKQKPLLVEVVSVKDNVINII